ncbi:hypothetical protein [Pseudomonas fluorescens]|uniref:hypothetical protein n=1 Tax=Pseudomonas fluorescens TaxID=294 RepID=UPI0038129FB1
MITGLERILLEKYQPDSPKLQESLQAPVSVDKAKLLPITKEVIKGSQGEPEEAADNNLSPNMQALMKLLKQLHKK